MVSLKGGTLLYGLMAGIRGGLAGDTVWHT